MSTSYLKKIYLKKDFGKLSFIIGIFFLPSAFSLSLIFLLIALIISAIRNKTNYLNDKYNISFLVASLLLITSSVVHAFRDELENPYDYDSTLSWIGLANWIPLFWCFYG